MKDTERPEGQELNPPALALGHLRAGSSPSQTRRDTSRTTASTDALAAT